MNGQTFYSDKRWLLSSGVMKLDQAFFSESSARRRARDISEAKGGIVSVYPQERVAGAWKTVGQVVRIEGL